MVPTDCFIIWIGKLPTDCFIIWIGKLTLCSIMFYYYFQCIKNEKFEGLLEAKAWRYFKNGNTRRNFLSFTGFILGNRLGIYDPPPYQRGCSFYESLHQKGCEIYDPLYQRRFGSTTPHLLVASLVIINVRVREIILRFARHFDR